MKHVIVHILFYSISIIANLLCETFPSLYSIVHMCRHWQHRHIKLFKLKYFKFF